MTNLLIAVILVEKCSFSNLLRCKRCTDIEVYVSLILLDTDKDAVAVFTFRLHIFMLAGNHDFACLKDIALRIFILNDHRNDVQFLEILL